MLFKFLCDSGRKPDLTKSVRAIFTTRGQEMMMDMPQAIFDDVSTVTDRSPKTGDIWGGSIILSYRIELLTMVSTTMAYIDCLQMYELANLNPLFLSEEVYLDSLSRRFNVANASISSASLSTFLMVTPIKPYSDLECTLRVLPHYSL
jgi:hypothetical protein